MKGAPHETRGHAGAPWPAPRMKVAPLRSATTRLKPRHWLASNDTIASTAAAAVVLAKASNGHSPPLRFPPAGPNDPGRLSTAAETPWALRPIQVPPAVRSLPAITPGYSGH